jgi:hypothetical protein
MKLGFGSDSFDHFSFESMLSIEHEGVMLSRIEGLAKSVALLKNNVALAEESDFKPPEF